MALKLFVVSTTGSDQYAIANGQRAVIFQIRGQNNVANAQQVVLKDGARVIETYEAGAIPVGGINFPGGLEIQNPVLNLTEGCGPIQLLAAPII